MNYLEKLSIAPMMDVTDRHFRYFMRLITRQTTLYTEMVHTNQIIHGGALRFLEFNLEESPVVLQLGGSEPESLARCSKIGEEFGYQAVNLNVGCPSERVQKGSFGACLMKQKNLVTECIAAMQAAVKIPVTLKTRLGVDEFEDEAFFFDFIDTLAQTGCKHFIIHARKAWLKGLNPKQNRTVPPLNYERVYRLKQQFPELTIIINGGIRTLAEAKQHSEFVDGVMIGREAQNDPFMFAKADALLGDFNVEISRLEIIKAYLPYVRQQLERGVKFIFLLRPMLGLFHGLPRARAWRGFITTEVVRSAHGLALLEKLLDSDSFKLQQPDSNHIPQESAIALYGSDQME